MPIEKGSALQVLPSCSKYQPPQWLGCSVFPLNMFFTQSSFSLKFKHFNVASWVCYIPLFLMPTKSNIYAEKDH